MHTGQGLEGAGEGVCRVGKIWIGSEETDM